MTVAGVKISPSNVSLGVSTILEQFACLGSGVHGACPIRRGSVFESQNCLKCDNCGQTFVSPEFIQLTQMPVPRFVAATIKTDGQFGDNYITAQVAGQICLKVEVPGLIQVYLDKLQQFAEETKE